MKIILFSLLFFSFLICGEASLSVEVFAKSAILVDANSGRVLFEKEAKKVSFPASITKIATTLYALEKNKTLDAIVKVSREATRKVSVKEKANFQKTPSYILEVGGAKLGMQAGEVLPLKTLIYGMMVASANDAANVIAEFTSNSIPQFVGELNLYVQKMGCKDTHFCNPHGLHHPNHLTTAWDIAQLTRKALQNSFFQKVVSSSSFVYPKTNKQQERSISQTNRLLKKGCFYYPYAIGVKTGYTSSAGYTLVAAARKDQRTLICVLLGCKTSDERYLDAKLLFSKAFAERKRSRTFWEKQKTFSVKVSGAKDPLKVSLARDFIWEFYPAEEVETKVSIHWGDLSLPIEKGKKVGEFWLCSKEGEFLQKESLFAQERVEKSFWGSLKTHF